MLTDHITPEYAALSRAHSALYRLEWGRLPRQGVREALDGACRIAPDRWQDRRETIVLGHDGQVWHLCTRRNWGSGPAENYRGHDGEAAYYTRPAADPATAISAVREWAHAYIAIHPVPGRRDEHRDILAATRAWLAER